MCEECRHYPCVSSCPNFEPPVAYKCDCCGEDIYVGETVYIVNDKSHYCEYCCSQTEAEIPEPDEDYEYERWRDRQWEQEHDV